MSRPSVSASLKGMNAQETTRRDLNTGDFFHAYLFISANSLVLEEAAQKLISETGCLKQDISIVEIGEEDNFKEIPVEKIRGLIHDLSLSAHGKYRIGIIKDAQKLNSSSANVLLKTLEEPVKNVIIILMAARDNVITTIKSRCRVIKINSDLATAVSNNFSYQDFLEGPLFIAFKRIEEIVKADQSEEFLNYIAFVFEKMLSASFLKSPAISLEKIIRAHKKISQNANQRLVLENLILNLRSNYAK